jgi:ABC-2 type transport system ATP-binding protein
MEEAERLADRLAVIADGEIVAEGTPQTLGGRNHAAAEITFSVPPGMQVPLALVEQPGGRVTVSTTSVARDLHSLSGWALDHGVELEDLEVRRPTLEDVYLNLTTTRS